MMVRTYFFVAFLFCCGAAPLQAQNPAAAQPDAPACTQKDLDTHFELFQGPAHTFNLAVLGQNISGRTCLFDGHMYDLSVDPRYDIPPRDPARGEAFPECHDCDHWMRKGKRYDPRRLVQPGEIVRETFRWKTAPSTGPVACLAGAWISAPSYILGVPSLLKHFCSDISVVGVKVLPATAALTTPDPAGDRLHIAAPEGPLYAGEGLRLQVSGAMPSLSPQQRQTCPKMFLWHREPDEVMTRLDEADAVNFRGCPEFFRHPQGGWRTGFTLDAQGWYPGELELQAFALVGSFANGTAHLAASNLLDVRLLDPLSIPRQWSRTDGLGANISLEKDTYRLGENIPLHMAIADFDAPAPLFESRGCIADIMEVLDAKGHRLPYSERFPPFLSCLYGGPPPPAFPRGRVVPLEVDLRSAGWLPNRPGTYTIVLNWTPLENYVDPKDSDFDRSFFPFATVTARATIHIVAGQNGKSQRQ